MALRAVPTTDCMTAHWALSHVLFGCASNHIIQAVRASAPVGSEIGGKRPATIEWK